ncbi:class I SAM-dependent methyltransferase family protein [Candidatus Bathyarchaeota archaeon]|nr:class I SAM-dependent methyltransferase family protein [Candidatus Bathyarchaeota archaeon]
MRSLKDKLAVLLTPSELKTFFKGFDIVGDIAIIKVSNAFEDKAKNIAKIIMESHRNVRTVLRQASPISGDLRLRKLEWICGEDKTETIHREYGCLFKVDLARCYFSPRLSYEHMRIARQVKPGEVIVNMFAGVGGFSIMIAKHVEVKKIYSIDINPAAVQYMRINANLNKVMDIIEPIEGDAKEVIMSKLGGVVDRVLMPLPERAYEYLDYALMALKPEGGIIHFYAFEHAEKDEDPIKKIIEKVSRKLSSLSVEFEILFARIVRSVGPRWYQVVLDIFVKTTLKNEALSS